MAITKDTLDSIGHPESELLEYKAVLPPAGTIAQLICAFANTKGGAIVLGVVDQGKGITINGLSDEFRAAQITAKAINLLSPTPLVNSEYVVHDGKQLFVIEVLQSGKEVSFGGKVYFRSGDRTTLKPAEPVKLLTEPGIEKLRKAFAQQRTACTEARAKLLDHYESVLRILDDLAKLLYPQGPSVPTNNPEGKMLMRILFSSCADTFETFMSDLLYQIYLAQPNVLKSEAPVTVKEVLDNTTMDEFIRWYAKEKLKKLERGSVRGFIDENKSIRPLKVFDQVRIDEIQRTMQIRHLYTHKNGVVDDKFRQFFPATKVNDEYLMTLHEFLKRFEYLADAIRAVDDEARKVFNLALYS